MSTKSELEKFYHGLRDGSIPKDFSLEANCKNEDKKIHRIVESVLFKVAKELDIKAFTDFTRNLSLDKCSIKLTSEELKVLKAGKSLPAWADVLEWGTKPPVGSGGKVRWVTKPPKTIGG